MLFKKRESDKLEKGGESSQSDYYSNSTKKLANFRKQQYKNDKERMSLRKKSSITVAMESDMGNQTCFSSKPNLTLKREKSKKFKDASCMVLPVKESPISFNNNNNKQTEDDDDDKIIIVREDEMVDEYNKIDGKYKKKKTTTATTTTTAMTATAMTATATTETATTATATTGMGKEEMQNEIPLDDFEFIIPSKSTKSKKSLKIDKIDYDDNNSEDKDSISIDKSMTPTTTTTGKTTTATTAAAAAVTTTTINEEMDEEKPKIKFKNMFKKDNAKKSRIPRRRKESLSKI